MQNVGCNADVCRSCLHLQGDVNMQQPVPILVTDPLDNELQTAASCPVLESENDGLAGVLFFDVMQESYL